MNRVLLVAAREIRTTASRRSFVISTILVLAGIIAAAFIGAFFLERSLTEPKHTPIAVTNELASLEPTLLAVGSAMNFQVEVSLLDHDSATLALTTDTIRAWVGGEVGKLELRFQKAPGDPAIEQLVNQALQSYVLSAEISNLGGDPAVVLAQVAASAPQITFVQQDSGAALDPGKLAVAFAMLMLLFMGIVFSGSMISMGVVEEKSSRVVEILLAVLTPTQLFMGKVLGIGALALIQVLTYAVAGTSAAAASGLLKFVDVPMGPHLAWLALWFLIGFAMFVVLWGGISAMASRQEDVGAVTAPMMLLLLIPFYTAYFLPTGAPDSLATRITSMAPFTAPFVMPMRQVFVAVPAWELAASIAVSLATIGACVKLAAHIYHRGVVHTGARMGFREVLRRR